MTGYEQSISVGDRVALAMYLSDQRLSAQDSVSGRVWSSATVLIVTL
jgi:hypothetical protein